MRRVKKSDRELIVLLKGGPYDGQDIRVAKEEWMQGTLTRQGHRYVAQIPDPAADTVRAGSKVFTWVAPKRIRN